MSEPFIAEVRIFAGNFAPRGWAFCNGQLLPIAQNTALFSLVGTIYGGDGRSTFGLPNLQGRALIGEGTGPGLARRRLGETGGSETVTLNEDNLPPHTHALNTANIATSRAPAGKLPAAARIYAAPGDSVNMSTAAIGASNSGGQPVNNIQPYLAMNYIIALVGLFPSRS